MLLRYYKESSYSEMLMSEFIVTFFTQYLTIVYHVLCNLG